MSDQTENASGTSAQDRNAAFLDPIASWIAERLESERDRWPLWIPVGFGVGIAVYFALPLEPHPFVGLGAFIAASVVWLIVRKAHGFISISALCLLVCIAGFAVAQGRTMWVDAPILVKEHGPAWISGVILDVDPRTSGVRVVFAVDDVVGLEAHLMPRRVRVSIRTKGVEPVPGMTARVRAVLMPPPEPVAPGAFDFGRALYFRGIGAVGYAVGSLEAIDNGSDAPATRLIEQLSAFRLAVAERINTAMNEAGASAQSAPVAVALLTGLRGQIAEDVLVALRDAGLAHLLAISGLHLGLIAGITFFTIRLGLALRERLALDYPIKKWAAVAALIVAFGYLCLTGGTVPTQRAFIMVAIVLLAILVDREAISMRPVAWAAMMVLLLRPESLLSASFQMSFAAVTALVAFYEWLRRRAVVRSRPPEAWQRPLIYLGAVAATTVVASLATGPFAAYHFDRIALAGMIANLVAVPLTAFWIMPLGLLALVLMPLGMEGFALVPMAWGIDWVIAVAQFGAALPAAVYLVPAWPAAALVAMTAGGLWLTLWRGRWRLAGIVPIVVGVIAAATARGPDLLVDDEGKLFAVRASSGDLALSTRRTKKFDAEIWLRRNGQAIPWPWADEDPTAWPDGRLRCDTLGCFYQGSGDVGVSLIKQPAALAEDCHVSDVVLSAVPVRTLCDRPRITVDRFDLWRNGAYAVWLGPDGDVRIENVREQRGDRPWVTDRLAETQ